MAMRQNKRVKTAWLKAREQARKTFIQAELQQLGESLKVRQLQPVWSDTEGVLIVGERRWRAAKLVGIDELDAVVTDEKLSPTEIKRIQVEENWHRSDLTPWERFVSVRDILHLNPDMELKELAGWVHIDASMLTRVMSPSKCIPAVQEAFQSGALGLTDVYAISKADSQQEQHEMLAAKLGGATRDELERTVRRKRNGTPSVKVSRLVIPVKGCTVTVAGEGLGFDEMLESCAEVVKEGRKAQGQGLDVKTFSRVMSDKAKGAKS
jgi:ParB family transcriptional regulator, chromosome partitioning protein